MNQGFYGYPDKSGNLRVSTTTLTSTAGWDKLLLAGRPARNSLQIWRNGVLQTSGYTVKGREVVFSSRIGGSEVVKDQYLTADVVGASQFLGYVELSLPVQTLSLSPQGYWKLNETSGTTAADSSGNGRDATYINSPTLNQSAIFAGASAATQFDGSNDYVEYTGTAFDSYTSAFSLQVVVYPTANNGSIFTHRYSSQVPFALMKGAESNTDRYQGGFYNGSWRFATESSAQALNVAQHLVLTWDGTIITLYRNGTSVATNTPGSSPNAENTATGMRIGGRWDGNPPSSTFFTGKISDVAIWNTCLTGANVTGLYSVLS